MASPRVPGVALLLACVACVACAAQACREQPAAQATETHSINAGAAGESGADATPLQLQDVSVDLHAPHVAELDAQFQTQWCWAATIANVFAYHGHPVSQARVVAEAYGVVENLKSGPYANIASLLDRDWVDDDGHAFSSRVIGSLDLMAGVQALNNDAMRDALASDEPVVVATTSHAMLVVGMSFMADAEHVREVRSVQVFDPWPTIGFRALSPQEATPTAYGGTLMFLARVSVFEPDEPGASGRQ